MYTKRRRVALRARVAVPVPGAAEVAALLDDADVVDAGFLQPGAGDEAGEAAADERDRHVVGLRLALDDRACTGRRGSGRAGPSSWMYWSLPSGRSRLSRSSAYFCLSASLSIVSITGE